ncbi:MAG TPA: response regulator transcription factor [Opitutaceae bacterium]|nr:response regulator transcription factor [Opitutaceae bacterium]
MSKTPEIYTIPAKPKPYDPSHKSRIVLVDDHPVTRQGVAALIDQEPSLCVCGEADNAPAALSLIQKLSPDLAIIDISLKTTNGIELTKSIRATAPTLPVLVMSMHDEGLYAERAVRAGAQGYIMKQEASEKILTAIHSVLHGEIFLSPQIKDRILNRMLNKKNKPVGFSIDSLSDREMEVFQLIGNGFGSRQIAAKLNLSVKTIDSYREHLKIKLQLRTSSELIRYAIQWVKSESLT